MSVAAPKRTRKASRATGPWCYVETASFRRERDRLDKIARAMHKASLKPAKISRTVAKEHEAAKDRKRMALPAMSLCDQAGEMRVEARDALDRLRAAHMDGHDGGTVGLACEICRELDRVEEYLILATSLIAKTDRDDGREP